MARGRRASIILRGGQKSVRMQQPAASRASSPLPTYTALQRALMHLQVSLLKPPSRAAPEDSASNEEHKRLKMVFDALDAIILESMPSPAPRPPNKKTTRREALEEFARVLSP
jgi:hypothetical protein